MQSGAWFDAAILDPSNRLGVTPGSSAWRPDLVADPRLADPGADGWIDAAAFTVPRTADGSYRYGNLRRNSLLGPGYFNLDAGLTKDVRLGGNRRLQLSWEVFNVTNHPSYGLPNANLGSRTLTRTAPPPFSGSTPRRTEPSDCRKIVRFRLTRPSIAIPVPRPIAATVISARSPSPPSLFRIMRGGIPNAIGRRGKQQYQA
ncbi:hypothetical protein BH18ACI5_BH18ACI5_22050 [soil metagenome]